MGAGAVLWLSSSAVPFLILSLLSFTLVLFWLFSLLYPQIPLPFHFPSCSFGQQKRFCKTTVLPLRAGMGSVSHRLVPGLGYCKEDPGRDPGCPAQEQSRASYIA